MILKRLPGIGKQRMFIGPKVYIVMCECFIDVLYGKFPGFSKFKGYIVSTCGGGIVDLPNITLTRKEFPVGDENLLKEKRIGARVSCVLDVHSKHMLTLKNCLKKKNSQKNKNQKFGFKFYSTGSIPICLFNNKKI